MSQEKSQVKREIYKFILEVEELASIIKNAILRIAPSEARINSDSELGCFNEEEKKKILDFDARFRSLVKKAEDKGIIEKDFLKKYEKYTQAQWKTEKLYQEGKIHYKIYTKSFFDLYDKVDTKNLITEFENRKFGYKIAAAITSITLLIPLVILAIYCIDSELTHKEIESRNLGEKNLWEKNFEVCEKLGAEQGDLYYYAAKLVPYKSIFKSFKQTTEEAEETNSYSTRSPRFDGST